MDLVGLFCIAEWNCLILNKNRNHQGSNFYQNCCNVAKKSGKSKKPIKDSSSKEDDERDVPKMSTTSSKRVPRSKKN
jgi:hypothetical protein